MQHTDTEHVLAYIHAELNRVQTIAGTLAGVEAQHYLDLTGMGDDKLNRIALEEQNAARQLGEVKQICLSLAMEIDAMRKHGVH